MRARVLAPEIMDDAEGDYAAFSSALDDLERLNRLTLAYRPTLAWLDALVARTGATRLSLLDVGSGGGDTLARLARWGEARGVALDLAGLDRSPHAAAHARARHPHLRARWITSDLFDLDPAERFDAVTCALFAHHLDDGGVARFLRWLDDRATVSWLITDLHRHRLSWAGVWAGTRLLRMHPMTRHDGPVSVARGFQRDDWTRLLAEAGVRAEVRWAFPFRWAVEGGPALDARRDGADDGATVATR